MEENNKNRNSIKDKTKSSFRRLIDKEGFYIILFLCICIVATTAVWVSRNNVNKLDTIENKQDNQLEQTDLPQNNFTEDSNEQYEEAKEENPSIEVMETTEDKNIQNTKEKPAQDKNKAIETANVASANTTANVKKKSKQEILKSMMLPVNGKLSLDYAKDKLVYSKTLEQWTTHLGIDISAKQGSVVRAVLDGTVAKIEKDTRLGIVITLNHGNGIQTRYANLSTDSMVKVGQAVKKGDPISGIGKGVSFEMAQGPHLHFEVLVDGEHVNPKLYLPKFN
ncbi:M23 family metallopeptidase [Caldisalinibacter kiritimatiensis]|uniref:Peptidase M23B n=1 Tax=Caldisalinibacter kiritimatiensis TaxID=1304284 RepID=R1CEJ7_9FIRM|nr:M23 family metallopeptidase [Caldisalinibacter kiritimatiensis]EOD00720.1 peptidase M23B [Caldisalinibacter kiritimatiensis]